MTLLAEWIGAMLGLGMGLAISHKAAGGSAPAAEPSLDFSDATNSQYVPWLFGGYP